MKHKVIVFIVSYLVGTCFAVDNYFTRLPKKALDTTTTARTTTTGTTGTTATTRTTRTTGTPPTTTTPWTTGTTGTTATTRTRTTTTPPTTTSPWTTIPHCYGTLPKFSKTYYTATYHVANDIANRDEIYEDKLDTVETEDIIIYDSCAVVYVTGDYSDNFGINCGDTKCLLTVKNNLLDDVVRSQIEVLLELQAINTYSELTGTSTVIVSLPLQETLKAPQFTEKVYTANYTEADGTGKLSVEQEIQIVGVEDATQVEVVLEGENAEYFTVTHDGNHFSIEAADIPAQVIANEISILLNLKATKSGVSVPGSAGLVVKLPKKIAPSPFHFENNVYMADYIQKDKDSIKLEKPIQIEGDSEVTATLNVTGEYKDLFEWSYSEGVVTISLQNPLSSGVLEDNTAISLDLVATKNTEEITATLVIKLPKTQCTSNDDDNGEKIGFIAAIAVAGISLLALLIASVVYYLRIRRAKKIPEFRKSGNSADTGDAYAY